MQTRWKDSIRILNQIRKEFEPDVLVIDPTFTGLIPMRLRGDKLKVVCYGILPLSVTSKDSTPFGMGIVPKTFNDWKSEKSIAEFFCTESGVPSRTEAL